MILDMILVHFNGYFPVFVGKVIGYTDIAMEGFVMLAGFMVGHHYYPRYLQDRKRITVRLFYRAFQILLIQYILIFTINLPLYYILYEKIRQTESLPLFLVKSMLFLNQIGLMHILPTFIPLFLISPAILYLIGKNLTPLLVVCSISLFVLGNKYPYALDLGDKTIFPFILWQIYFVAGCILGENANVKGTILPNNINKYFYLSIPILFAANFMMHAKIFPIPIIAKFPLNALGLLYGSSFLFAIYTFTLKYWQVVREIRLFSYYIPLFGRHSLLAFVLHVYTAKGIAVVGHFNGNTYLDYLLMLSSVIMIYKILSLYEARVRISPFYLFSTN